MGSEATRDERVAARVELIAKKADFPAFSQQIEETLRVLGDESVSAQQLAELVLRNYGLTLKVLRAANSLAVNRTGSPIFSVAQAIFRLGVERIRAIVSGLVFFEHFHAKTGPVKELVVLSLVTAHQAGAAAARIGHPKPEEAYLCGMLRNLGEILVACYFPDEFSRIRLRAVQPGSSQGAACLAVMGFTYEELGKAMAARWGMPEQVAETMSAEPLDGVKPGPPLAALTALAHGLTAAVYRGDPKDARPRIALLAQKIGAPLGLTHEAMKDITESAAVEARRTFAKLNFRPKDLSVLDRTRSLQAFGRDTAHATPTPAAAVPAAAAAPPPPIAPADSAPPADAGAAAPADALAHITKTELFDRLASEVDQVLEARASGDLHAVLLMILEAMQRGAGFDRVLFGLVSPDRRLVQGRLAIGPRSESLKTLFNFPLGLSGGPLGVALARQQELILRADWELRRDELELLAKLGARLLGVFPVIVQGVLVGCLYYDRITSVEPPTAEVAAGLRTLRDRAARVLSRPPAVRR